MIEVRGLTKRFGSTLAVDNLTFDVRPGVVTGFLGPNGAGKSTTMRMVLGLDRPTRGQALVNGHPYVKAKTPLAEVGALLDATQVHGGRTGRAHLRALARSNGLPATRVDEVLELTGLTEVAGRRIKGFSLGMAQRLGIAAAMLGDPQVLLFDEPVNGLDPEGILWIRTFMRSLADQGRTVLVSSHLMSEMALTADHLVVIGRGRLLADVSTEEFVATYSKGQVRVRSDHQDELARLLAERDLATTGVDGYLQVSGTSTDEVAELAFANQILVRELFAQSSSLEAAFMQMTKDSVDFHAGAENDPASAGQELPGQAAGIAPPGDAAATAPTQGRR